MRNYLLKFKRICGWLVFLRFCDIFFFLQKFLFFIFFSKNCVRKCQDWIVYFIGKSKEKLTYRLSVFRQNFPFSRNRLGQCKMLKFLKLNIKKKKEAREGREGGREGEKKGCLVMFKNVKARNSKFQENFIEINF